MSIDPLKIEFFYAKYKIMIPSNAIMIAIGGGSGSGKTTIAKMFAGVISGFTTVAMISQDWFYRELLPGESSLDRNWDHPDAFDWILMRSVIDNMKLGISTSVPTYDYSNNTQSNALYIKAARVVIFEGILALDDRIRGAFDHTIYINCDQDIALGRRMCRDIRERGRTADNVLRQYITYVKPAYEQFIKPTLGRAEFIIDTTRDDHLTASSGWQEIIKIIVNGASKI